MKKKYLFSFILLFLLGTLPLILIYLMSDRIALLNPKGLIAQKELTLINIAFILMLIVVIPVFILTILISWKYRASNKKAKYTPDWEYSFVAEAIWWGFPFIIIAILSIITWLSTIELDPYRPIEHPEKAMTIQVVALDWKWLFIYPEQQIATVNFLQFPKEIPIHFEITADAPMNSFWIPQLGGQIYAMPAMKTQLYLIAHEIGDYRGSSANLSGRGFAGMNFTARASSQEDFDQWVASAKQAPSLDLQRYQELAKPSEYDPIAIYSLAEKNLFDWIVMKPMMPMSEMKEISQKNLDP